LARALDDLDFDPILDAMSHGDRFLRDVARTLLSAGSKGEPATVAYRQEALRDALRNPQWIRSMYDLVVDTCEQRRRFYISVYHLLPGSVLHDARSALRMLVDALRRTRDMAAEAAPALTSPAFTRFVSRLQHDLDEPYLAAVERQLTELSFGSGLLMGARLGDHNEGIDYTLRRPQPGSGRWLDRVFSGRDTTYTYRLADRDQAGARMVSELRDRGVNLVANALAQSSDHVLHFFRVLRAQLAFYVGCLNLHEALRTLDAPLCMPTAAPLGSRSFVCADLYDVALALRLHQRPVGNDIDATSKAAVLITGANQGGKSTFLRAVGQAHLMMQCGMFTAGSALSASMVAGIFTHFRQAEDATMRHGKLEEELARMSTIIDGLARGSLVMLNESFAATNAREGAEIAWQVVTALQEAGVQVFFVTHLYEFARRLLLERPAHVLVLAASRTDDGIRTFKLVAGPPPETSSARDIFSEVFSLSVPVLH
jgi:hypothetical protein